MASLNHSTIIKAFEKLAEDSNPSEFFFGFLKALKFSAATIKRIQQPGNNRNIATVPGDIGLPKQIYFHPAKAGEDLQSTLKTLIDDPGLQKHQIRFFLTTDFENVVAYDRRVDDWTSFAFKDLRENYEFFLPLTGLYEKPLAYSAHPADVRACEKMGKLYDVIRALNHYEKDQLHDLNVFLTRLLFCFFAEDTGIFPKEGQLTQAIESITKADGSDLADFFERLFWILDMAPDQPGRALETSTLKDFPYVNGGLFHEKIRIPTFNTKARNILLECGRLSWHEISPVIFGAMFQAVMDPEARHELGAHYTSEKNIFKVIGPLFLDDLKAELEKILADKSTHRNRKLKVFQTKLASLKFLDPACGCGNFLIVTYRELKKLELEVAKEIYTNEQRKQSLFDDWRNKISQVSINQFYGIEIEEFPVDVARVSMWLMEHVMNSEFSKFFGNVFPSIPLRDSVNITKANALTTDWQSFVPINQLNFIFGNPPFGGASVISKEQKAEILSVFNGVKNAGIFDYVSGWYGRAMQYLDVNPNIQCSFVSTNSICQGEQVEPLWGTLFDRGLRINFAHQTFKWQNEARENAGVYCVIIGFSKQESEKNILFRYETPLSDPCATFVSSINGYLLDLPVRLICTSHNAHISAPHPMVRGNQPTDGGSLIIEPEDLPLFESEEALLPYIKKLIGSRELLHNIPRYCLWLVNAPDSVKQIPIVADRIEKCRQMRLASRDPGCRKLSQRPHEFRDLNNPESAIVIPGVSSERRSYIPMGFIGKDTITTNLCHIVPNGTLYEFGILESCLHMTWMRTVCGRLKSDYRYSRDLCYNTFPWPKVSESDKKTIENLAQNILMIREYYPDKTLADLYDPELMPEDLLKAHQELDLAVDKLYRKKPFANDEDRLRHLFARYEKLVKGEDDSNLFNQE